MDVITISIARGQSTAEAKKYAEKAMPAAQEAAGYAGAAKYALGPDADGKLAFFYNDDEKEG